MIHSSIIIDIIIIASGDLEVLTTVTMVDMEVMDMVDMAITMDTVDLITTMVMVDIIIIMVVDTIQIIGTTMAVVISQLKFMVHEMVVL